MTERYSIDSSGRVLEIFGHPVVGMPEGASNKHLLQFSRHIERQSKTGCWLWRGTQRGSGYGCIWIGNRRMMPAHRFSYGALIGSIAANNHVHHECCNPLCVNPSHLKQVTPRDHVLKHTPNAVTTQFAARTHCGEGHELSGDNLRIAADGDRKCRTCIRAYLKERYWRKKAERPAKTHCKRGHLWIPENIGQDKKKKYCKVCAKENVENFWTRVDASGEPYKPRKIKTHCKLGHDMTPENTYNHSGRSVCRICRNAMNKAYFDKKRAEAISVKNE